MGRGGHNVKSTEELKRSGSYNATLHKNRVKLKEVDGVPPSPFEDEYRTQRWVHYCELMQETHHLTQRHLDGIELMCNLDADWIEVSENIKRTGITFTTETGQIKANPAVSIKLNIQSQMMRMYEQFGMTPRSSMNMKALPEPDVKDTDPFEEVLAMMARTETSKPAVKRAKA